MDRRFLSAGGISFILLVVFAVIAMLIYSVNQIGTLFNMAPDNSQSKYDWKCEYPEMSHYWACMDGCRFMGHVILDNISYENKTHEKYHSDCSEVCWEQLIEQEGNYTR